MNEVFLPQYLAIQVMGEGIPAYLQDCYVQDRLQELEDKYLGLCPIDKYPSANGSQMNVVDHEPGVSGSDLFSIQHG